MQTAPFHSRPFQVLNTGDFVDALLAQITDAAVKRFTNKRLIGNIDQFSDSTDLREDANHRAHLSEEAV